MVVRLEFGNGHDGDNDGGNAGMLEDIKPGVKSSEVCIRVKKDYALQHVIDQEKLFPGDIGHTGSLVGLCPHILSVWRVYLLE